MTTEIDNLRKLFTKLVAHRNEEDKPLTQQAMADQLNADGVLSLSGKPWSKYSVRRILKKFDFAETTADAGGGARAGAGKKSAGGKQAQRASSDDALKDTAPLRQWSYYESIRGMIEELTRKPYTNEDLAKALNRKGVATADGKPWTAASAGRAVKALGSTATPSQVSEDEIRDRIRKGVYDTESERFVAVPVKKKKKKEKSETASEDEPKKKKKKKKKDKKK